MGDHPVQEKTAPVQPAAAKAPAAAVDVGVRRRWRRRIGLVALLVVSASLSARYLWPRQDRRQDAPEIVRVRRGEVLKTLLAEGAVESVRNVELKCKVAGGSTLLWVIADGTQVKQGDEVARLDSSLIDEQLGEQLILVEQAAAAKISAERSVEATEISIEEYREGIYVQTRQELELNVSLAEHNLRQAEHKLVQSRRLARRGFINDVQLSAEIAGVERTQLELGIARRALSVLDDYTRPKMLQELTSLHGGAQATLKAAKATFDLEQSRLERLQTQQANCVLRAPQDGMAIHANDSDSNSSLEGPQIDLGVRIRQRQTILRLPNLEQMQVKVLVHESQVMHVHPGLKARIRVQGHDFTGEVTTLANQPERTRSSQAHIKNYAAIVRIDPSAEHLRPGQTAETEILLARHSDVLTVPVTAVVQQGDETFTWLHDGDAPERRQVRLGVVDENWAEISGGLHEGDALVSNPRVQLAELLYAGERGPRLDAVQRFGLSRSGEPQGGPPAPSSLKTQPQTASGGG
ncbi:MAG TPA: hypothetical protein VGN42_10225 [Pirellulales bacterium]|jgi:multidrug resistance efflux pump|nr:hypothetical protein [Pirellulales bacterium]